MEKLKRLSLSALLVFALSFACILFGNVVFDSSPETSAAISRDEADLCLELNTYIEGDHEGEVDAQGNFDCLIIMDED